MQFEDGGGSGHSQVRNASTALLHVLDEDTTAWVAMHLSIGVKHQFCASNQSKHHAAGRARAAEAGLQAAAHCRANKHIHSMLGLPTWSSAGGAAAGGVRRPARRPAVSMKNGQAGDGTSRHSGHGPNTLPRTGRHDSRPDATPIRQSHLGKSSVGLGSSLQPAWPGMVHQGRPCLPGRRAGSRRRLRRAAEGFCRTERSGVNS